MQIEQDENLIKEKQKSKSKKIMAIIFALILIVAIAVITLIVMLMSKTDNKLTVSINGKNVSYTSDTFLFAQDGSIYVSIRDIAPLVGYDAHNGEYKIDVEDTTKMYVEALDGTETTSFYLNSNIISKVAPNTTEDYKNIKISEPVVTLNGKLYIISDGFSVAFNSLFGYDKIKNRITIQTLPNLVTAYTTRIADYGYSKISEDFNNQKALVYGMIVASKETNGKYGVITTSGNEIISPRYNKIQFVESAGEFIITNSSQKVGIAYGTGKTKITVSYDEIKVIDSTLGLYLVKSNNKYGVIDASEKFIVHIEYDQIGVETSSFTADNIKNQYILYDKIIAAKLNGKWILLDIEGNRLTNDEYDTVGFINKDIKDKVVNNALAIGDTNTIVVSKDGKYGGIDVKGNTLIQLRFDAIYSITSGGETSYYILYNNTEYNAVELIDRMKQIIGGYENETVEVTQKQEQNVTSEGEKAVNTNTIIGE